MSTIAGDKSVTMDHMEETSRGQQIRQRRRVLGLTQTELAAEADLSLTSIRNVERDTAGDKTVRLVDGTLTRLELAAAGIAAPAVIEIPPARSDPATAALIKMTLAIGEPDNMHTENYGGALRVEYWVRPANMTEARFAEVIAEAARARNRRQGDRPNG